MLKGNKYTSYFGYGMDVAAVRADDLDKAALEYIETLEAPKALDLGCGAGGQSLRMQEAGAVVTAIDIDDFSSFFSVHKSNSESNAQNLDFVQGDLRQIADLVGDSEYDVIVLQRTLHYLSYQEANNLLLALKAKCLGKMFVSVSGLESYLGEDYKDKEVAVGQRFALLNAVDVEKFGISKPICLYSRFEFEQLLSETGWQIESCWTSAFGNHKAICA
tara:strand:+ start:7 stop:660 length:654 start_codon:yes stop_codon:yes gene_type:complete